MNRTSFTRIGTFFISDDRMRATGLPLCVQRKSKDFFNAVAFATAHKAFTFDDRREGFRYKNWNLRVLSIKIIPPMITLGRIPLQALESENPLHQNVTTDDYPGKDSITSIGI